MAVEIRHTDAYARWFRTVDDRIDFGPGYRVYHVSRGL